MDQGFDTYIISKAISLRREYTYIASESMTKQFSNISKNEIFSLTKSLLEFLDCKPNGVNLNDPKSFTECIKTGLGKLMDVSECIVRGYDEYYLNDLKARKKVSFEHISKPQLLFKDIIDNSETAFVPKIVEKYYQLTQLDPFLLECQSTRQVPTGYHFPNPYHFELERLQLNYSQLTKILTRQLDDVVLSSNSFVYVDTIETLNNMIELINESNIIAFDVHNHSFRSYQGFVCFIEISTEKEDFVVDCLKLRDHIHLLNKPFSNPNIFKLALDSKDKLLWLQRDFGVYVLNLFDLKFVLNNLGLPNSLPFLANKFLEFSFKNIYTEFDFRKRPISSQEKLYLRSFSHFILRIFFKLKGLIPKFGIDTFYEEVFEESKKFCLLAYVKPHSDDGYFTLFNDLKSHLTMNKLNKLKKLISWRDMTARLEDESREYILPDELIHTIIQDVPKDVESLKNTIKTYPYEVSLAHSDTIFTLLEDKTAFQEKKVMSKFELNENGTDVLQTLFTPNRQVLKVLNTGNEKESPACDQNELHKLIHWSSGKKTDIGEQFNTPRKRFDDFLSKGVLTPSILKDSPSENLNDELMHVMNVINMRNDSNHMRKEILKFSSYKGSEAKLKEIKEEEQIDVLEFMTTKENVPQNIGEIYELGNCIRKKNKNKKKKEFKGGRIPGDTIPIEPFNSITPQKTELQKKNSQKSSNDDEIINSDHILRDLGWIDQ